MFAVVGTWAMDPSMREQQAAFLPTLVDGVRQAPGFVRGFWCDDVADPDVSLTLVVFDELEQATAFRESVIANSPNQSELGVGREGLRIVEVRAHA